MSSNRRNAIKFVKSSDVSNFLSLQAPDDGSSSNIQKNLLTGDEARTCYEAIISEEVSAPNGSAYRPSTSSLPRHKTRREDRPTDPDSLKALKEFTARDHRLFFKAATHGDVQSMVNFLRDYKDVSINLKDEHGWTPLMCAAAAGKLDSVKFITASGGDVDICDSQGRTAESLSCSFNHDDVYSYLQGTRSKSKPCSSQETTNPSDAKTCSDCGVSYTDKTHFSSIVHLVATTKPVETPGYGIPEWNMGYQLLQKTGWQETQGLGKHGKGTRYPIKTALKRNRKGLGLEKNVVKRVTHPEAHLDAPRPTSSRKSVLKERTMQMERDRRIAMKIRREFV
uniref:G-patch domain-containing protein n=1 Tax=Steinernema glaseri TaxID=37863 RepID=A0A1I7Y5N1_9BILA